MGPKVHFAGLENTYFASAMASDAATAERCQILLSDRYAGDEDPHGTLFEARLVYPRQEIAGGASTTYRTLLYLGPKETEALQAAGHSLPAVVDFGWFSDIAKGLVKLLSVIYGGVGNWGIAIILMTLLFRIAFFPLTIKSFQSMGKMRQLKPEMDRINELYKDDREKKGAAVMELYRKHKINPLGGCLPQLLQMPVWFAFYASLSTNIELYHAPFVLYWVDLSAPDPYFTLPLAIGLLMFLQQRLTPTTMDPMQAKMMMYFMPVMITSFMLFLPAGLCLYMVTNSVLGITQQRWIMARLDKPKRAGAQALTPAEATASGGAAPDADDPGRRKIKLKSQKKRRKGRG
jgi:YidC/Oxa1 family membrane protein insertase